MEKNPLHFFRIQKTDRYLRIKIGLLNIYLSWRPLSTRNKHEQGSRRDKRKKLKSQLLSERGFCQHCGRPLTWDTASIHHIVPKAVDPAREFDKSNLMLLCADCHVRIHKVEQLEAKQNRVCALN